MSAAPPGPYIRGAGSRSAIAGRYIVVLKDTATLRQQGVAARARTLSDAHRGTVGYVYDRSLHGFSVAMSEAQARRLAADPDVAYVEQDQLVRAGDTQESPPSWGLDRIDQRTLPLDSTYTYDTTDSPVTAYVVDSGIRITHQDFGGRARYGWDFIDNDPVADDCAGHGTHVAGTIGGRTYGVAKSVKLVAVRVLGCDAVGPLSAIEAGVNWVTAVAVKPAVASMSITIFCVDGSGNVVPCAADVDASLNAAIANSVASGITWVVLAGNKNVNACGDVVARTASAITVGATDATDQKAGYSNWGSCVDIFAPGTTITSDWYTSDTATNTMSGTSMATPHATGAVALILGRPGWATKTPAQIKAELLSNATTGAITGLDAGSPNKLVYTVPPPMAGGSSIAAVRNADGRLDLFGVNRSGGLLYRFQTGAGITSWSGWTQSIQPGWYSVAAQPDADAFITLAGLHRTPQDIWYRRQAYLNSESWSAWYPLDGALNSIALAANSARCLEIFGTNALGQGWHRVQTAPGATTYTAWEPFGMGAVLRSMAAETNTNGRIEVFTLTSTGQIWHRWQAPPGSPVASYTPWVQLDGSLASIAVARNADGALELFGVNALGQVFHRHAASGTNNWFSWSQLDDPPAVGTLRSLAAEAMGDGRVALFGVNTTGQIWYRWQTSAGSDTYSAWTALDGTLRP